MQWLIDAIGKLAPAAIAFAVYWANRRQTEWNNAVSTRAAAVEDQKFRLSLLDRRASAIDAIRAAWMEFSSLGEATEQVLTKLDEGLRVAELIFEDDDYRAVHELKHTLLQWRLLKRQYERWTERDPERAAATEEKALAAEERLLELFTSVPEQLRSAAQIQQVAPLSVASQATGWLARLRG